MPKPKLHAPNLTQHPPRSPHVKLGGYVHLPRLLDKARATATGTNGNYHYDCPVDDHFWEFTGIKPGAFMQQVKTGKGDGEMLAWIKKHTRRTGAEIAAWSAWMVQRAPAETEGRAWFNSVHKKLAPQREDISTWFEFLDLDDYVSFGGKP